MGMDTLAYRKVVLNEEGLSFEESYDELNGRTKNWFKYPNGELPDIARKFFEVSKGDVDFRYFVNYDKVMDCYDEPDYLEKCKVFFEELQAIDFNKAVADLEQALRYYDEYELDFSPSRYRDESDRVIVEYLLELAKQRYYVIYDV